MILWAAGASPVPAPPGTYTAKIIVKGATPFEAAVPLEYRKDPRLSASASDLVAKFDLTMKVGARVNDANDAVIRIRDLKRQIEEAAKAAGDDQPIQNGAKNLADGLTEVEEEIYQVRNRSGQDPLNYPVKLNNKLAALIGVIQGSDFRPTDQSYEVFDELSKQLDVHLRRLKEIMDKELAPFNALLAPKGIKAVAVGPTAAAEGRGEVLRARRSRAMKSAAGAA
jgi:hypothetical protein